MARQLNVRILVYFINGFDAALNSSLNHWGISPSGHFLFMSWRSVCIEGLVLSCCFV